MHDLTLFPNLQRFYQQQLHINTSTTNSTDTSTTKSTPTDSRNNSKQVTVTPLSRTSLEINLPLAKNGYSINVGYNLLAHITEVCPELINKEVLIVTNEQVCYLYLDPIYRNLKSHTKKLHVVIVANGEIAKTQPYLDQIYQALLEHNYSRSCVILALGGGSVGDLAGYAAATYLRGVSVIQVPTTLLAQVDASIGGKTAIDHPLGKNMIGTFHQPKRVVIDLTVLDTLEPRDLYAGMGEVVKYGFIMDQPFLTWLDQHITQIYELIPNLTSICTNLELASLESVNNLEATKLEVNNLKSTNSEQANYSQLALLLDMIASCCFYKAQVILDDELEKTGQRALLNFGHTYGHAIEADSHYLLPHGECVAMGMVLALFLSYYLQHQTITDNIFDSTSLPQPEELAQEFYQYMSKVYSADHNSNSNHSYDSNHTGFIVTTKSARNHFNQTKFNFMDSKIDAQLTKLNGNFSSQEIKLNDIYSAILLIAKCRLPLFFPQQMALADFMTYISRDKKVDNGKLTFISLDYLGKAIVSKDLSVELINYTITTVKALVKLLTKN